MFYILLQVNNEDIPKRLLDIFYTDLHVHDVVFAVVWNVLAVDGKDSVNRPSMKRSS
jgi:hypothetical protein